MTWPEPAALDPGEDAEGQFPRIDHERGLDAVVHAVKFQCSVDLAAEGLPDGIAQQVGIVGAHAVVSDRTL